MQLQLAPAAFGCPAQRFSLGRNTNLHFYRPDRDIPAQCAMRRRIAQRPGLGDITLPFAPTANHVCRVLPGPPSESWSTRLYGARIGNRNCCFRCNGALGERLDRRFRGWRVACHKRAGLPSTGPAFTQTALWCRRRLEVTLFPNSPLNNSCE